VREKLKFAKNVVLGLFAMLLFFVLAFYSLGGFVKFIHAARDAWEAR
jgi:hypothetical protein